MKYDNLRAFQKHLEASYPDNFCSVYLIIGKEEFERKSAVSFLTDTLLKDHNINGLALKTFDAGESKADLILQELNTFSFFSKKRVILIENGEKLNKQDLALLLSYIAKPQKDTYLVISLEALLATTSFYKQAEKAGVILNLLEEKPWEKEKNSSVWVMNHLHQAGKKISDRAASYFVKQVGSDRSLLALELEKLICYLGERVDVTIQDIAAVCSVVNMESIWQLGEAIFQRDAPAAVKISRALLTDGTHLLALLKQIRYQFQTTYQVCSILSRGGGSVEVSTEFPYMKGKILERHIQMARGYGMNSFREGLLLIDQTEFLSKNFSQEPEFLSDLLMMKLTK